ncbi:MAG: PKD domain-containing protein [Planctomycetota bacterium]|jgi:hypothetical protein
MKAFIIWATAVIVLATCNVADALTTTGWAEYPSNPVYTDEDGKAYYPTIITDGGSYMMWYASHTDIRMATSSDGISWTGPTVCEGLTNANHPLVKKIDGTYRIWYWNTGVSIYGISALRCAESANGTDWDNDQSLTQDAGCPLITGSGTGWSSGSYGPGDVIHNPGGSDTLDDTSIWNNKYVMYYMATNGSNEYIGLAYSVDGRHWKRYGAAPVLSPCTIYDDPSVGWDYRSVGYPTVIEGAGGVWHMWFCGGPNTNHGIGYAWSSDGVNWTKDASNLIFHREDDGAEWRDERTYTPVVIGDQMWFSGKDMDTGVYAIGYAAPSCIAVAIESLAAEPLVVQIGEAVDFEASIVGGCGLIDALWDFDDGTFDSQTDVEDPVTVGHTYTSAGVYTVVLTVSDDVGDDVDSIVVVAYDPDGGFVTGGGWFWSPAGAYLPNMELEGKASFGFVSKYRKGAKEPTGQIEFVFKTADLNFHSTSYDWLVVTGSDYAKYKGAGTINGWPEEYKFMLWAGDGEPDTFAIKIWEEDEESGDEMPIYQNLEDQPIDGGSIVIHTK